jgi:uncharacterized membrane protein HdeD (DUF308 family)
MRDEPHHLGSRVRSPFFAGSPIALDRAHRYLAVAVGALMIGRPISGAFSLTLLLIAFFLIEGIASIMFALDHRRYLAGAWGWMLASGIVDLLIVAVIFAGLPGLALWVLGILLGINLTVGGVALVAMALQARKIASTASTAV